VNVTKEEYQDLQEENRVISLALAELALKKDQPAKTRKLAKRLAARFVYALHLSHETFEKGAAWLAESAHIDAEMSTSHEKEYLTLARRALERDPEAASDLGTREYKPGEDPDDPAEE
jgi:hypothetical protein